MIHAVVILPTYSHFDFARKAIDSLLAHTEGVKVIIIDDASKDWEKQRWDMWEKGRLATYHFSKNGGLTRSWNLGLRMARDLGAEFTVCANSDILATPGWFDSIAWSLNNGVHLTGPLTNAPGHRPKQQIRRYIKDYLITDRGDYLAKVARRVREENGAKVYLESGVNGFCMVAKTSVWWSGSYNNECVFNPKHKMTGNEDELQRRWRKRGRLIAVTLGSFVFHYRGVSRKEGKRGKASEGWYRPQKTR